MAVAPPAPRAPEPAAPQTAASSNDSGPAADSGPASKRPPRRATRAAVRSRRRSASRARAATGAVRRRQAASQAPVIRAAAPAARRRRARRRARGARAARRASPRASRSSGGATAPLRRSAVLARRLPRRLRRAAAGRARGGVRRSRRARRRAWRAAATACCASCRSRPGGAARARRCPLVGFSDGTALLAYAARAGVASVHGPVRDPARRTCRRRSARRCSGCSRSRRPACCSPSSTRSSRAARAGRCWAATSRSSRASWGRRSCPTSRARSCSSRISGERPYRVDRLVTHLDLAGVFSAVAARHRGRLLVVHGARAHARPSPTAAEVLVERLGPARRSPSCVGGALRPRHAQRRAALRLPLPSSTPSTARSSLSKASSASEPRRRSPSVRAGGVRALLESQLNSACSSRVDRLELVDLAEALLVAADVELQRAQQALGVARRGDDARCARARAARAGCR